MIGLWFEDDVFWFCGKWPLWDFFDALVLLLEAVVEVVWTAEYWTCCQKAAAVC